MGDCPDILPCRICGGSAYLPLAVPVRDKGMPHGVDFIFSSRFLCLTCKNVVDIFDGSSIKKHLSIE